MDERRDKAKLEIRIDSLNELADAMRVRLVHLGEAVWGDTPSNPECGVPVGSNHMAQLDRLMDTLEGMNQMVAQLEEYL